MGMFLVRESGVYVQGMVHVCLLLLALPPLTPLVLLSVGMGTPNAIVPISAFANKQARLTGSFRYGAGDYALAISLVASGRISLARLVTHRFAFTDAVAAFQATKEGKGADGKGIIKAMSELARSGGDAGAR